MYIKFARSANSQSFKKFFPSLEISIQGTHQQILSKTSGTAQKICRTHRYQLINQSCPVHIDKTIFTHLVKALYTNGIFHYSLFLKRIVNAKINRYLCINNKSWKKAHSSIWRNNQTVSFFRFCYNLIFWKVLYWGFKGGNMIMYFIVGLVLLRPKYILYVFFG